MPLLPIIVSVLINIILNSNVLATRDGKEKEGEAGHIVPSIPKLRILIVCEDIPITNSHFQLHKAIAEVLANDQINVEKVVCFIQIES